MARALGQRPLYGRTAGRYPNHWFARDGVKCSAHRARPQHILMVPVVMHGLEFSGTVISCKWRRYCARCARLTAERYCRDLGPLLPPGCDLLLLGLERE